MDTTALDRQNRRLERLRLEGISRSTVFVHEECREALNALRPLLLNPLQAPLIQQVLFEAQERTQPTNVANVAILSPFRYPGGKTWLVPELRRWLSIIRPTSIFVEPFAGGASCSLMVAAENRADMVVLGELDADVVSVWQSIFCKERADIQWLCKRILTFDVNETNVREVLVKTHKSKRERAWRTIIRNRMQRGGILAPGAGLIKSGQNGRGLSSRWYPETLVKRMTFLQNLHDRVQVVQMDAFDLIALHKGNKNATFLIDPPYTAAGKKAGERLYTHHAIDHEKLFSVMSKVKGAVMMTYDDTPEVCAMSERYGFAISRVPMKSTHHQVHKELVITKK